MLYLPINRSWIVSRWAQRVYFGCAIANLYLLAVLAGTQTAMVESGVASLAASPSAALLVKGLLWPGIIGTALLSIAMWYFWFTFDQSHWMKKALWFVVLFMGNCVGTSPLLRFCVSWERSTRRAGLNRTAPPTDCYAREGRCEEHRRPTPDRPSATIFP